MRLEDVARIAKVSISTVSRVVNGVQTVNASTRKRVLKALAETEYRPNLQARSLVAGRTKTIGVIVSNLLNPFFVDVFHAIESGAREQGYEVLVGNTNYQADILQTYVHMLVGRRVAGVALVVSEELPPSIDELHRARIPIAVYDAVSQDKSFASIRLDSRKGMMRVLDHLHSLGHKRLAYVGVSSSLRGADDRRSTFIERTREHGMFTDFQAIAWRDGMEGGRSAVRQIVKSGFKPTAIVCVNDVTAIGALQELRDQRISVPGDISVTGFDNIAFAEFTSPALTTVHVPREKIGNLMIKALITDAAERSVLRHDHLLTPDLVLRESTGMAPAAGP